MIENIEIYNNTLKERLSLSMNDKSFYILDSCDWSQVQNNKQSYSFVNQIGSQITSIALLERSVSISGWIICNEEENEIMSFRKHSLNRFFNPKHLFTLVYKNKQIDFYLDTSIQYTTEQASNNEVICQFKITGICPFPLFADSDINEEENSIVESSFSTFHFPLTIEENVGFGFGVFSYKRDSELIVVNGGEIETGFKLTFSTLDHEIKNPKILNVNTSEFIELNLTLEKGQKVIISTESGSKYVKRINLDETEENIYSLMLDSSSWLQIESGDNVFLLSSADENVNNLICKIEYTNKYFEVQEWD